MEKIMLNGFNEMSDMEMFDVNAGGWKSFTKALIGGTLVSTSPVACATGGFGLGGLFFSVGCSLLDDACDNYDD